MEMKEHQKKSEKEIGHTSTSILCTRIPPDGCVINSKMYWFFLLCSSLLICFCWSVCVDQTDLTVKRVLSYWSPWSGTNILYRTWERSMNTPPMPCREMNLGTPAYLKSNWNDVFYTCTLYASVYVCVNVGLDLWLFYSQWQISKI